MAPKEKMIIRKRIWNTHREKTVYLHCNLLWRG